MKTVYKHKIRYQQNIRPQPLKARKRNIIWFNLPYTANVGIKVEKHLLLLLVKKFQPHNKSPKILNRNTVKISYSLMSNMETTTNSHNHNFSNRNTILKERTCNCIDKAKCSLSQTASLTASFTKQY